jgi:hypothetical protein
MLSIIRSNAAGYVCGVNNAPPAFRFYVVRLCFLFDADRTGLPEYLLRSMVMCSRFGAFLAGISAVNGLPLAY